ncbi:hypothetical protein CYLTODRAFT_489909 [Cylindrobasidium torrendii FP15055 ss-10]|uniref:Uncharacterized protein n=1 Tax=Cylindrobasidium torrendii FP15055 ss-10 TaxID=1314674 RepID=A0A0D7BCP3_9AGAR|nr:hypothetical protein CYLTODRAFT_489909 [Cylindrobasidium torrendii FP15055 ss-10]
MSLARKLAAFRLTYPAAPQPYPWQWLTPFVVTSFALLTVLLTIINIPLAAYERVVQFTYTPNDTSDADDRFWGLLPGYLAQKVDDIEEFQPQTVYIGDRLSLSRSIYPYTVGFVWAPDNETTSWKYVSSFAYSNNDISKCFISDFALDWAASQTEAGFSFTDGGAKASIQCWDPVPYRLVFNSKDLITTNKSLDDFTFTNRFNIVSGVSINTSLSMYPQDMWFHEYEELKHIITETVSNAAAENGGNLTINMNVKAAYEQTNLESTMTVTPSTANSSALLNLETLSRYILPLFYQCITLDLSRIEPVSVFQDPDSVIPLIEEALSPIVRNSTYSTWTGDDWKTFAKTVNDTVNTPSFAYQRSVWRRKPIGSAIVGVYSATFTMLSLAWTIFAIVAAFFAERQRKANPDQDGEDVRDLSDRIRQLEAMMYKRPALLHANDTDASSYLLEKPGNTGGYTHTPSRDSFVRSNGREV